MGQGYLTRSRRGRRRRRGGRRARRVRNPRRTPIAPVRRTMEAYPGDLPRMLTFGGPLWGCAMGTYPWGPPLGFDTWNAQWEPATGVYHGNRPTRLKTATYSRGRTKGPRKATVMGRDRPGRVTIFVDGLPPRERLTIRGEGHRRGWGPPLGGRAAAIGEGHGIG